ncbi:GNAT family N-acetyltransferase [Cyclobacterium marinum]|uniref:GNAT family N-acetyltransferase n=1 Tax=Cyclobacterium marinum TaxID=104 RepID=UPI0030DC7468|tara:strand:+ start:51987 stop:52847 length:861 start_codon:yes stop_codon:yes gene_type:complete
MDSELFLREMQLSDLEAAMRLKTVEGWNQTEADWQLILAENPSLCLVVEGEDAVVGTVCAYSYQNKLAWIGMMLVDRSYRRRGISKRLMREVIQRIGDKQTIKLDATPAGQKVYEQLGFVKEYSLFRWIRPKEASSIKESVTVEVQVVTPDDFPDILSYDYKVFGLDRAKLLEQLFERLPNGAFLVKEREEIVGYVFCRLGSKLLQLGPMIASNDFVAQTLITRILKTFEGHDFVLDLGVHHYKLYSWLVNRGFVKQRELIRMYIPPNKVKEELANYYLITGPELG